MIRNFLLPTATLYMLSLFSCTSTQIAMTPKESGFELYINKLPERPFAEVAYIETSGAVFHRPQKLMNDMSKKAKAMGADGLIDVRYDYVFWWPYVSATAIKFTP